MWFKKKKQPIVEPSKTLAQHLAELDDEVLAIRKQLNRIERKVYNDMRRLYEDEEPVGKDNGNKKSEQDFFKDFKF